MIWDACLARAVAAELHERLGGARATAISFLRAEREVRVNLRDATLRVELAPGLGTITVGPGSEREEGAEPLPAIVAEARALPDERIVVVRFRRVRGKRPHPALIVELAANRWNALFAEGPDMRIRRRLRILGKSAPRVGQPWAGAGGKGAGAPVEAADPGVGDSSAGAGAAAGRREMPGRSGWDALMREEDAGKRRGRLLRRVAYLSGLNVDHVLRAEDADEAFRRWRRMAEGREARPHLLRRRTGPQPYPWGMGEEGAVAAGSLLEAMEAVRAADAPHGGGGEGGVGRVLGRRTRRLKRKARRLGQELEKAKEGPALRDDASLILASLNRIEPGSERALLTDFEGKPRTIDLDPRLRPHEHAAALFRRASRLERAERELPERIRAVEEELAQVAALRRRHADGELGRAEAAEILSRPERRASRAGGEAGGRGQATLPYRSFRSSGGIEIRVGRGKRHNDALTFHHSRPDDIWLHARHAAGAHVIMRWSHPERPPAADLREAATLAAAHSKARGSAHVPVDWTRRKWVRKPRGAAPGLVVPDRVATVFVTPGKDSVP